MLKPLLVAVGLLSDLRMQDGDALVSVSFCSWFPRCSQLMMKAQIQSADWTRALSVTNSHEIISLSVCPVI